MPDNFPNIDLSNKLVIKVRYGSDVRKVLVNNEDMTYDDLQLMMQRVFKDRVSVKDDVLIKYKDEDGDLITIADNGDLNLAIQWNRVLNLTLFVNDLPKPLEDGEVVEIRRELKEIRDRANVVLDRLDLHASFEPRVTQRDRTSLEKHSGKAFKAVGGSEINGYMNVNDVAPPAPGHHTFKEGREFDPLSARADSQHRPEEPVQNNEASRSETPASIGSSTDVSRREQIPPTDSFAPQPNYFAPKETVSMHEPPAPTIHPSVQQEVYPPHQNVLPAASAPNFFAGQPQQPHLASGAPPQFGVSQGQGASPFGAHPTPPSVQPQQIHQAQFQQGAPQGLQRGPPVGAPSFQQQQPPQQAPTPPIPQQFQQHQTSNAPTSVSAPPQFQSQAYGYGGGQQPPQQPQHGHYGQQPPPVASGQQQFQPQPNAPGGYQPPPPGPPQQQQQAPQGFPPAPPMSAGGPPTGPPMMPGGGGANPFALRGAAGGYRPQYNATQQY